MFETAFGVYTGECDYVTVSQPLKAALSTCNELVFELTHDRLTAGEGVVAEGYVGLAIDDELLFEKTVPIPAPPLYEEIRVPMDRDIPAGTPIVPHPQPRLERVAAPLPRTCRSGRRCAALT